MTQDETGKGGLAGLLFDLGDTLMIEESEEKEADGTTLRADLLPGAADMLRRLHARGHRLALVADSRPQTPPNVLAQHGLLELFERLTISEVVGAMKPDALMFTDALDAMAIGRERYRDVVMVGNNLERDVVGANRLGIISVFLQWNERRRIRPLTDEEQPDYTVHSTEELEGLIARLDAGERPARHAPAAPGVMAKLDNLRSLLADIGSVVVAFSGGVDSTLLLKAAHDVLGDAVVAVSIDSPSQPRADVAEAQALAGAIGARHVLLPSVEMSDPLYLANTPERCYVCKRHICAALIEFARTQGIAHVADGSNADDLHDFRPGQRATREFGLRYPLQEAGLRKDEIRSLARHLGLANWNKPSAACLSSRLPYGEAITVDKLTQIEQAEAFLRARGFAQVRVRHHGPVARVEVAESDLTRAVQMHVAIVEGLRASGFQYVALDLVGFRSGSMNEVLGETWTRRT